MALIILKTEFSSPAGARGSDVDVDSREYIWGRLCSEIFIHSPVGTYLLGKFRVREAFSEGLFGKFKRCVQAWS